MQGPPQQYYGMLPQQLGAMQGATPPQRTVAMPAESMNYQGQMMQMANQGYVGPSMRAQYFGQAQLPMIMQPPAVPDTSVVALGVQEGAPGHTGAVTTTAKKFQFFFKIEI